MRELVVAGVFVAACSSASSDTAPLTFPKQAYADHITALKQRLAAKGLGNLAIRIEDPFVVVGNGTAAQLERSSQTVRWAADKLEAGFFTKRPAQILDIYLFTDAASYEKGVKALTGESPTTPYGFYSASERGLFMNIATGGGTLVHEIVHPYVEADFPGAPPWLNEGLGSLFEQSGEKDGRIVGQTNWRLAGLQKAIGKQRTRTIKSLTSLGGAGFYADESGLHYAMSRYLLYYVQEKGLVNAYYKAFRANRAKDPTGYATLQATLGERDMADFQKRWEKWVLTLRFP